MGSRKGERGERVQGTLPQIKTTLRLTAAPVLQAQDI